MHNLKNRKSIRKICRAIEIFIYLINQSNILRMRRSLKFFNKRGVSPLIATILLISFAVALGSVVLNWGRNLDISKPGDKCASISIKLLTVDGFHVCYSVAGADSHIKFIIENIGNFDVDGLGVWITGEKSTKLLDFNNVLIKKGEVLDIKDNSIKYDFNTYGSIKNIQFFPKVKTEGSMEICTRGSVKADKVGACKT